MLRTIRQIADALTSIAVSLKLQQSALEELNAQNADTLRRRAEWEQVEREHMAVCERLYQQRRAVEYTGEPPSGPVRH